MLKVVVKNLHFFILDSCNILSEVSNSQRNCDNFYVGCNWGTKCQFCSATKTNEKQFVNEKISGAECIYHNYGSNAFSNIFRLTGNNISNYTKIVCIASHIKEIDINFTTIN